MLNIKNNIKKILHNKYFPIILLTIIMIAFHLRFQITGDDFYFSNVLNSDSIVKYLINRYNSWTGRLIIEFFLASILSIGFWLWKIIDIIVVDILYIVIAKLINSEDQEYINWLILIFILLYKFTAMRSAGWAATTLNYLWPLSFGLASLIPIKKLIQGKKIKWYEYILFTLALIYSANEEQMCIILIGTYLLICIYTFVFCKKKNVLPIIYLGLCIISIIFIFSCPGNSIRKNQEILNWFPGYNMLTFIDKVAISITSTMAEYICTFHLIFIIFTFLLFLVVSVKYKNIFYRGIALVPLIINIIFSINTLTKNNSIKIIELYDFKHINNLNYDKLSSYIPITLCILMILLICISIYLIFENNKSTLLCIFIFIIGLLSRMALVFSPTLYASGERTFIFFTFSMIIIMLIILKKLKFIIDDALREQKIIEVVFTFCFIMLFVKLMLFRYFF